MPCQHLEIILLSEHPKEENCKAMGDKQYYWALCCRCESTLLRPFEDYEYTGKKHSDKFHIIYARK